MKTNYNISRNYTGTFLVDGEEFRGELVYNRESGTISLNLAKELFLDFTDDDPNSYTHKEMEKKFDRLESIPGKIDAGSPVILFDCRCTHNSVSLNEYSRDLRFKANHMIWNDADAEGRKYKKLICILENALQWSQMTQIDYQFKNNHLEFKSIDKYPTFNWYGTKITFGTTLENTWFSEYQESTHIIERLQFAIQVPEDKDVSFFLEIRDKVIALISYAIKDNVNIARQWLAHRDDIIHYPENCDYKPKYKEHLQYDLITSEPYHIVERKSSREYNFILPQLPQDEDLADKLDKLIPVFNLYLSLFKYRDMPIEMVFLNMIQAAETFHARFFYDEEKNKRFLDDIIKAYAHTPIPEFIFDIDTNDTELVKKQGKKVKLTPRIKHMLIHPKNQLFWGFCNDGGEVVNQIVNTRNYFTHYGPKRKLKSVQGKDLEYIIDFLALLLEYHIGEQLNLQIDGKVEIVADNDYSDYGFYMKELCKKRDYLLQKLPVDLSKYN